MCNNVLTFENISFAYKGKKKEKITPILDDLSLTINSGEFISLLGPSGSGKSTIFRLITGLEQPTSGCISLDGKKEINRLGKVGYMPQQDMLLDWRNILDNAFLPLEINGFTKKNKKAHVLHLLEEFGLKGHEYDYPHQLSGGMRQRVSFLRAMLGGGDLLLLDEPFSALDAVTRLNMQEWLLGQWEKLEKTVIFITHDVDEALFLSDRIFLFSQTPLSSYKEIKVPLPRPRKLENLLSPELSKIKSDLLNELRQQVKL
ncbi:ABC transporter ATP-binding protein [Alkalihalobacterium elongatum]|uniref:ABC transporter ATP-binding protein n=1 Tax=Alkalihalobacterium elongatum TaxID=2675466 RepID=UPI001C1F9217|nr:ABC transporter ATP-binding protein [Alkalihalobacterium elongatum]